MSPMIGPRLTIGIDHHSAVPPSRSIFFSSRTITSSIRASVGNWRTAISAHLGGGARTSPEDPHHHRLEAPREFAEDPFLGQLHRGLEQEQQAQALLPRALGEPPTAGLGAQEEEPRQDRKSVV